MKLLRFLKGDTAAIGVLKEGRIVALDALSAEFPTMSAIVAGGDAALARIEAHVKGKPDGLPPGSVRLLAPIEKPGKYLAIGMNFRKHAAEAARLGVETPKQQFWFNKQTSCVSGPYDAIEPGVSEKVDYEVELCAVIGQRAKYVKAADAPRHVFGYMVANDVSARDWQAHSPTFTVGKSFDTHGPIGPWIVTADEIGDPHALRLRTWVNGELRQDSDTSQLIHNIWQQIEYLSTAFTLEPGDLLATGTPDGVGIARTPPVFLQAGDVVRCEIEKIGHIENKVAARSASCP